MDSWPSRKVVVVAALSIVASFVLVWPVGDYLLDDDWAFLKSLETLHTTGEVRILDWIAMSLVAHLYWGLLFTKLFGFGMTVTRVSTVVLALVECLALAGLLRRAGVREPAILLAVVALLFGPLHFFAAHLYATDIPANAWMVLSLLFYLRGLIEHGPRGDRLLLAGSALAGLAFSVRQSAVLVVPAVGLYLLLFERQRLARVGTWLSCFALPVLAALVVSGWYYGIHGQTEAHVAAQNNIAQHLGQLGPASAGRAAYWLVAYVALFVLPVLVAVPWRSFLPEGSRGWTDAGAAGVLLLVGFFLVSVESGGFPYLRNKLSAFGYLHPNEVLVGARDVLWPSELGWVFAGVLLLAAFGGVLLWLRGLPTSTESGDENGTGRARTLGVRLLGLLLALQFVYSFLALGIVFDRHLVMMAPVAIALFILLADARGPLRPLRFALVMLPLGFYSVAGTHDVHAFSRAAFTAGDALVAEGTDPQWIDGGYAFNGWHMYERSREELAAGRPPLARRGDAWYVSVVTPRVLSKYVVSLSERMDADAWMGAVAPWAGWYVSLPRLDPYRSAGSVPYVNYWPPGEKRVYILEDTRLPDPQAFLDAQ